MSTIMPQNELVRRAAAHVAAELADRTDKGEANRADLHRLLDDAAMRFNLTPLDQQALERLFLTPPQSGATSAR